MNARARFGVVALTFATVVGMGAARASHATTTLVSRSSSGVVGDGRSLSAAVSDTGRFVAFESMADNLVPGDTNTLNDIFVRDLVAGTTARVSVATGGAQGNSHSGCPLHYCTDTGPAISGDGRYVAFRSYANNLVAGDTNGVADVFVHDRQAGTTSRVSAATGGTQGNGDSGTGSRVAISADGRHVAFSSLASNLVAGDANGVPDVFAHDRQTGTTTRVSISSAGVEGNAGSVMPDVSSDGRYVVFASTAHNLAGPDTARTLDVFLRDRLAGTTSRISKDAGDHRDPTISGDGRYVAFSGGSGGRVWVRDRYTGVVTAVSPPGVAVEHPVIARAGRYVAYATRELVTRFFWEVLVYDRETGATTRASASSSALSVDPFGFSAQPAISAFGAVVAFSSETDDLVAGDGNSERDVFVRNRGPKCSNGLREDGPVSTQLHHLEPPAGVAGPAVHTLSCDGAAAAGL